ncbi:unnamed protein product, partial [Amoebophrya sp. A25]
SAPSVVSSCPTTFLEDPSASSCGESEAVKNYAGEVEDDTGKEFVPHASEIPWLRHQQPLTETRWLEQLRERAASQAGVGNGCTRDGREAQLEEPEDPFSFSRKVILVESPLCKCLMRPEQSANIQLCIMLSMYCDGHHHRNLGNELPTIADMPKEDLIEEACNKLEEWSAHTESDLRKFGDRGIKAEEKTSEGAGSGSPRKSKDNSPRRVNAGNKMEGPKGEHIRNLLVVKRATKLHPNIQTSIMVTEPPEAPVEEEGNTVAENDKRAPCTFWKLHARSVSVDQKYKFHGRNHYGGFSVFGKKGESHDSATWNELALGHAYALDVVSIVAFPIKQPFKGVWKPEELKAKEIALRKRDEGKAEQKEEAGGEETAASSSSFSETKENGGSALLEKLEDTVAPKNAKSQDQDFTSDVELVDVLLVYGMAIRNPWGDTQANAGVRLNGFSKGEHWEPNPDHGMDAVDLLFMEFNGHQAEEEKQKANAAFQPNPKENYARRSHYMQKEGNTEPKLPNLKEHLFNIDDEDSWDKKGIEIFQLDEFCGWDMDARQMDDFAKELAKKDESLPPEAKEIREQIGKRRDSFFARIPRHCIKELEVQQFRSWNWLPFDELAKTIDVGKDAIDRIELTMVPLPHRHWSKHPPGTNIGVGVFPLGADGSRVPQLGDTRSEEQRRIDEEDGKKRQISMSKGEQLPLEDADPESTVILAAMEGNAESVLDPGTPASAANGEEKEKASEGDVQKDGAGQSTETADGAEAGDAADAGAADQGERENDHQPTEEPGAEQPGDDQSRQGAEATDVGAKQGAGGGDDQSSQ